MPVQVISIPSPYRHIVFAAGALALIAGCVYSATIGFANTIARNSDAVELSEFAVEASGGDPQAHYAYAADLERTFDPANIERSLTEYETAAALSPNNFIYWLGLGQARERAGERAEAEQAFRAALRLAPNYARTRWALGNNLVRQGKIDEGMELIRGAVDQDAAYTAPAVIAALQAFDGDTRRAVDALGSTPQAAAEAAKQLAGQERYDEAAATWQSIDPEARRSAKIADAGKEILAKLIGAKRFRDAAAVAADVSAENGIGYATGSISNGGFESGVSLQGAGPFAWQIGQGVYPQIALVERDPSEGKFSLAVIFNVPTDLGIRTISKLAPVEPGRSYDLLFSSKASLKTRAEFRWEVVSANDGVRLAVSGPAANESDWAEHRVRFAVPLDTDGVIVRMVREGCVPPSCTVEGNIWFDGFRLEPAG